MTDVVQETAPAAPPPARSMLWWGAFAFGVDTATFEMLERRAEWRWAEVERVGRRAALHYTGPGTSTVRVEGEILPAWRGRPSSLEAVMDMADTPAALTTSRLVLGTYVLTSLTDRRTELLADGTPRKTTYEIEWRRAPGDPDATRTSAIEALTDDVSTDADAATVAELLDATGDAATDVGERASAADFAEALNRLLRDGASDLNAIANLARLPGKAAALPAVLGDALVSAASETVGAFAARALPTAPLSTALRAVLDANRHVAEHVRLPLDTDLRVPDPPPNPRQVVRLWD